VRVVSVGEWARELCGGTHVKSSAELGLVKLLSESSIGAGVRRIEALVGFDAYNFLAREHVLLNSITELVKGAKSEELPERISDLIERLKTSERELGQIRSKEAMAAAATLADGGVQIGELTLIAAAVADGIGGDDLRAMALEIRSRKSGSVVALSSIVGGKVVLVAATSDEARNAGVKAGALVKAASAILGGGGGGKDDFAQGGGVDASANAAAFAEIAKLIQSTIDRA
jgi:alanyl-tRNA synthetase